MNSGAVGRGTSTHRQLLFSPPSVHRLRVGAFVLAAAAFTLSVGTGFLYALWSEHRLPTISLAYLSDADRAFAAGDLDRAITAYRTAATIAPDDERTFYRLGLALQQRGDYIEAVQAYRKAIAIDPSNKHTHYNLALALAELGALDEAVRHNLLAIRLDPEYVEAHTNLGAVLLRQGAVPRALEHFRAALRLRPGFPPATRALAAVGTTALEQSR